MSSDPGSNLEFLAGGGAMGERIRAYPWARTPLREPRFWPQGPAHDTTSDVHILGP